MQFDPTFLTDTWIKDVMSQYSLLISWTPLILIAIFQFLAIIDPRIPSSSLIEWVQQTFYRKPPDVKGGN